MSDDPYVYPGTDVLRNKFGVTTEAELRPLEAKHTFFRIAELDEAPIAGNFDLTHLNRIHGHIFQDVFEWAGQPRTVDISKPGRIDGERIDTPFARVDFIESEFARLHQRLASANFLRGLDADGFAQQAAGILGDLNVLHPYREGNGRSQREFIRELGLQAGHVLDWSQVSGQEMVQASIISAHFNNNALVSVLRKAIVGPALVEQQQQQQQAAAPAERDRSYLGPIESKNDKGVVQNVDGRLVRHQFADFMSGGYELLKPGNQVKIVYSGALWKVSDPNQQRRDQGKGRVRGS